MATLPEVNSAAAAVIQDEVQRREAEALIGLLRAWRDDDSQDQREILELLETELPRNRVHIPKRGHTDG